MGGRERGMGEGGGGRERGGVLVCGEWGRGREEVRESVGGNEREAKGERRMDGGR